MDTATFMIELAKIVPLTDEQAFAAGALFNAATTAPAPTPKPKREIVAPKSGVTKQVWNIADKITYDNRAKGGFPATKAEVVAAATAAGVKEATAQSSYSSWCHFFEINPKDPSKPYVHKVKEPKVDPAPEPQTEEVPAPSQVQYELPAMELPQCEHPPIVIPENDQVFPPTTFVPPAFTPPPPLPPSFLPPPPFPG